MSKREYSAEIAGIVDDLLTNDDWEYSFDEERGVFHFDLSLEGRLRRITYIIPVGESSLTVYGICPLNADHEDPAQMARMAEFICRANYGLIPNSFELDFSDGEIRLKSYIDCDDRLPTAQLVKNAIGKTAGVFKRYAPGILAILFNDRMTAKKAVDMCQNKRPRSIRDVLADIGENPDGDMREILMRLQERLETCCEAKDDDAESA